jgi:hypothetical protein
VVFHQQFEGPVGYFTLANDAIKLNDSEKFELGFGEHIELAAFPAVKIGRLAVHQDLHRKGVGVALMTLLLGDILNTAGLSAARLIVVDADNDDAVLRFYEKLGFETSLWAEEMAKNHTSVLSPPRSRCTGRLQRPLSTSAAASTVKGFQIGRPYAVEELSVAMNVVKAHE